MAWQFSTNNIIASGTPGGDSLGKALYELKNLLVATGPGPGWDLRGSGDGDLLFEDVDQATGGAGTGAGGAYDVLSSHTSWRNPKGAGDFGNPDSWYRVREPGSTREFCFSRYNIWNPSGVAQSETWVEIVFSPTGFTGGAPNATTRPTAADEQIIHAGTGALGSSNAYLSAMVEHVGVSDSPVNGVYAWYLVGMQAGGSTMYHYVIYEPVQEAQTGDTEPWVIIRGQDLTYDGGIDNGDVRFYSPLTTTFVGGDAVPFRTASGTTYAPRGLPVQADSFERAFPILVANAGSQIYKGYLTHYRWKGGSTRNYPDTRDLATANAQIYFNDMLAPWEQSTVPST